MVETGEAADRGAVSPRRRAVGSRWGLIWAAAGIGLAIAYGVAWLMGPHPDTTLQRTRGESRSQITTLLDYSPVEVDPATLEPYETFRGLQPWSATDALGNPCLIIIEPSTSYLHGAACTPREAELVVDVGAWPVNHDSFAEGLRDGTIIRFELRGDAVDVTVHRPPPSTVP
jgi:hypothetical protein